MEILILFFTILTTVTLWILGVFDWQCLLAIVGIIYFYSIGYAHGVKDEQDRQRPYSKMKYF